MEKVKPEIVNKYSEDGEGGIYKKIIIDEARIKHKDYFNMKYLYTMCHEWLMENNWGPSKDEKWPERLYLHRWFQDGSQELWIWWRFRKKFNQFMRYDLDIDFHCVGLEKAELVKDGKKFKMNNGEVEVKIYPKLIFDARGTFKKGIISGLKETFWQRVYYKDILSHRKQLYHELYQFKQALKTYFNLPLYLPETENNNFWKDDTLHTPFYEPATSGPAGAPPPSGPPK